MARWSRPVLIETELGTERVCSGCGEAWPYDSEFWFRHPKGIRGLQGRCKACRAERAGPRHPVVA